jgi:hypothetical protein
MDDDQDTRRELAADVQRLADLHADVNARLLKAGWAPPVAVYLCAGELIEFAERLRLGR